MEKYQIGRIYELAVERVYEHVVNGLKFPIVQPIGTRFKCACVDGAGNAWHYDGNDYMMIGNACTLNDGVVFEVQR